MMTLEALFGWVFIASVRASIIALVVLLIRKLCYSQLTARWRYALWFPVLVMLLVPALPVLPGWFRSPLERLDVPTIGQSSPVSEGLSAKVNERLEEDRRNSLGHDAVLDEHSKRTSNDSLAAAGGAVKSFTRARLFSILSGIWFAGAVFLTTAVCGVFRHTLLLNVQQLLQLTDGEVDMVLAHELTHIQRGDLWLNSLLCLLLAVHWFNPLLWVVFFSVRNDREAACDEDVLRGQGTSRRVVYGNALLKLETARALRLSLPFVGMLLSQSRLKERIHLIAHYRKMGGFMNAMLILLVSLPTFFGIARANGFQQQPQFGDADGIEAISTSQEAGGTNGAGS